MRKKCFSCRERERRRRKKEKGKEKKKKKEERSLRTFCCCLCVSQSVSVRVREKTVCRRENYLPTYPIRINFKLLYLLTYSNPFEKRNFFPYQWSTVLLKFVIVLPLWNGKTAWKVKSVSELWNCDFCEDFLSYFYLFVKHWIKETETESHIIFTTETLNGQSYFGLNLHHNFNPKK